MITLLPSAGGEQIKSRWKTSEAKKKKDKGDERAEELRSEHWNPAFT